MVDIKLSFLVVFKLIFGKYLVFRRLFQLPLDNLELSSYLNSFS